MLPVLSDSEHNVRLYKKWFSAYNRMCGCSTAVKEIKDIMASVLIRLKKKCRKM